MRSSCHLAAWCISVNETGWQPHAYPTLAWYCRVALSYTSRARPKKKTSTYSPIKLCDNNHMCNFMCNLIHIKHHFRPRDQYTRNIKIVRYWHGHARGRVSYRSPLSCRHLLLTGVHCVPPAHHEDAQHVIKGARTDEHVVMCTCVRDWPCARSKPLCGLKARSSAHVASPHVAFM